MKVKREFTPEEVATAAAEALTQWDWQAEEEASGQSVEDMQEALRFDAAYAARVFADDDGIIRLGRGYRDIWDLLDEFARATAAAAAANRQFWGA